MSFRCPVAVVVSAIEVLVVVVVVFTTEGVVVMNGPTTRK